MDALVQLMALILSHVLKLEKQGAIIMSIAQDLQAKVDALTAAEIAREARDVAQDAVTAAQITSLQTQMAALQAVVATGTLSPEETASIQASIANIDAVINSLNAADPTPPAVV